MSLVSRNFLGQLKFVAASAALLVICGCASRQEVADDYRDRFEQMGHSATNRTVIFFLVDGMPIYTVQNEMLAGKLPNLKDFFVGDKKQIAVARTAFPSLTYPSITSLLTESHVDQHGILGNLNEQNGKTISFESPSSYKALNATIKGKNIFSRLKAKGERTVSLDYAFHADSDAHIDTEDLESGISILGHDYNYIDIKTIDTLKAVLDGDHVTRWPDFIFVHLIGLDLTSHDHGPESREALDYLESLDASLSHVFRILNRAEKNGGRKIVVMMSADHGFDKKVSRYVDLESALKNTDHKIKFLNEGRYGSVFLPSSWSSGKRHSLVASLEAAPDMDIVAQRNGDEIFIESKDLEATIYYKVNDLKASDPVGIGSGKTLTSNGTNCPESAFLISVKSQVKTKASITNASVNAVTVSPFMCPEKLGAMTNNLFYPYFAANIAHYFYGHNHPDVVIIPKPGVAFSKEYLGQHGGPTPGELFVPLLLHNGALKPGAGIPSLSELLSFL